MATRAVDSCEIIVNDEAIGHDDAIGQSGHKYENVELKPVNVPSPMASITTARWAPIRPKRASKSPVKIIYSINHLFQKKNYRICPPTISWQFSLIVGSQLVMLMLWVFYLAYQEKVL